MAITPDQSCILLAVGSGGLLCLNLDIKAKPPALTRLTGDAGKLVLQVQCSEEETRSSEHLISVVFVSS